MKKTLTTFTIVVSLLAPVAAVHTQSKGEDASRESRHEKLGERINSIVEDVIARIGRGLSLSRENEDLFSVDSLRKKRARRSSTVNFEINDKSVTYEGSMTIEEKDTISGNIVVKAGDLTVHGLINGNVLVVGGDLYLKEGGHITGNAKVINGDIIKEEGGRIDGYMDKTSSSAESYREDETKFTRSSTRLNANWVSEVTNLDNFVFRYNRVEGTFLGLGSEKRYYWDGRKNWSAYGSVGWGFKSHRWRYNLGLSRQFAFDDGQLLEFGVEGHSLTDTKDQWIIGMHENSAAAILIHEDYRDYFGREGFGVNIGYALQQEYLTSQLKVEYLIDKYSSLRNNTEWSIFGGDKVFRLNPAIDNGKMRSILASAGVSTVTKTIHGLEGWSIYATAEFADRSFGSDFHFNQYIADFRRYQPLGGYDNINLRLRVGTSEGRLPPQKVFEMGGLSTLNAFPFKSEAGNRMILLNAEFIVNGDFLGDLDFWPSWFMRGINFLVLSDAGMVRNVSLNGYLTSGFEGIKISEFKHDVGVGVASRSGSVRLAVVWRTDRSEEPRFIFRFSRPF